MTAMSYKLSAPAAAHSKINCAQWSRIMDRSGAFVRFQSPYAHILFAPDNQSRIDSPEINAFFSFRNTRINKSGWLPRVTQQSRRCSIIFVQGAASIIFQHYLIKVQEQQPTFLAQSKLSFANFNYFRAQLPSLMLSAVELTRNLVT
jgi:hypothetical protein